MFTMVAIAALAVAAQAKFTTTLDVRSRAWMSTIEAGKGKSDNYTYNRVTDIRFRPGFSYEANAKLSANLKLEIGNLAFGGTDGGGWKTAPKYGDVNIETMYANIVAKPFANHTLTLGLQGYNDPHSLYIDEDVAGLKYDGQFDKLTLGLGWFALDDKNEANHDKKTYTFGTTMLTADLGMKLNENMSVGLNNALVLENLKDASGNVRNNTTSFYLAPNFSGKFGDMVQSDLEFVLNTRSYSHDALVSGATATDKDSETGYALSLKNSISANKELNIGVNFLLASGDKEGKDDYRTLSSFYETGLQIFTEGGLCDPATVGLFNSKGVMVPALTVDYAMNKQVNVGGGVGMAMLMEKVTVGDKEENMLGTEINLNSTIKMCDDKLNFSPFVAMLIPGKVHTSSQDTDMQMKAGVTVKASF